MAEVDKYFELSSHPGSGALVLHSVEGHTATLLPSLTSGRYPARLRLIDVANHPIGRRKRRAGTIRSLRLNSSVVWNQLRS
jgi:hypothetical protein